MRVLFAVHAPLDPRLGTAAASILVSSQLQKQGHDVELYGYNEAFPRAREFTASHQLRFPWQLARHLHKSGGKFDVVDATSGDIYVWERLGRPGGKLAVATVTRSNGSEHLAHRALIARARQGVVELSWRYPLYHGGFRLWEVSQSLRACDAALLLTDHERRFVIERLGIPGDKTIVVGHGVDESVLRSPQNVVRRRERGGPVRLCYLGGWGEYKGVADLVATVELLVQQGKPFDLLLAGTGIAEDVVAAAFSFPSRRHVRVVKRYDRQSLPDLLADRDLLVFLSRFEGFGMVVIEAMACGVVPIATPVGVVPDIITNGVNGWVVEPGKPEAVVEALDWSVRDGDRLDDMRRAAAATAREWTWERAARQTLELYDLARRRRLEALGRTRWPVRRTRP